jgi:alpha-L-fucosidase
MSSQRSQDVTYSAIGTANDSTPNTPVGDADSSDLSASPFGPLVGHREDEAMRAFRSYGLGQFIHWGLYSILGNEWEGRSARGHAAASEWIRAWDPATAPPNWPQAYDDLYKAFDPQDFDPRRWAREAKQMGARYLIFTTKHHDGFALWPSAYSDYTIAQSPYPGDVVGEVVQAYQAEGIDVFLYFSVLEWHHPDHVRHVPQTEDEKRRWDRFLQYTRAQLLELLERYPGVKGLWFDGTWDPSWVASAGFAYELEKELRAAVPGLIIGSRFRADGQGNRHFDAAGRLMGDYEQGWERKLPASFEQLDGNDWDCVMTVPPNGWGYVRDSSGMYLKDSADMIELLMRCRSMNGNLVINVGPDGDGNLPAHDRDLMQQAGRWQAANAPAIFPARHVGLPQPREGYLTADGENLYVTLVAVPVTGRLRLGFSKDAERAPVAARMLVGGETLQVRPADVGLDRDPLTYYDVTLPDRTSTDDGLPFVIDVTLGAPDVGPAALMEAYT